MDEKKIMERKRRKRSSLCPVCLLTLALNYIT
jgi:hypothetical protein